MTQCDAVLAHLQSGRTITPREAYEMFDCLALHSRIAELRERGYLIDCRLIHAGQKQYGEYRLVTATMPTEQLALA